jgi:3-(methylthio)propionyl---CoA ligase
MLGLMQARPLMISSLIQHAATFHREREIVSRLPEGGTRRTNYGEVHLRAKQAANALRGLGVKPGERVGTLAWNTHRHLTLYYAVSGIGAVLHTVNPRLSLEQLEYIINHAADKVLFFDVSFSAMLRTLAPRLKTVETFVAMTDQAHMPVLDVANLLCYEDLLDSQSAEYVWPELDENSAAAMCYTSGTTGNPKGVVYSHRSTVLSALVQLGADAFRVHSADTLLLAVPMFHSNAWGIPYCAAMVGARLVLSGPQLDGKSLYELLRDEGVTFSQAVPTVWLTLLQYLDANPNVDKTELALNRVAAGGAAVPRMLVERFERDLGCMVQQGWGMTETSAIGAICTPLPKHAMLPQDEQIAIKLKQGRGVWGVELKLVGDDGKVLPWDGHCFGHLHVRGPWVASSYFPNEPGSALDAEGWLPTGDVATIDPDGYIQIVDRTKDVIKSGGEWISSVALESVASTHPGVTDVAVIGVPHLKWQERPLLLAVKRPGFALSRNELLDYLASRVAKWWLPDDVVFVDELPRTATGKLLKARLRDEHRAHLLPVSIDAR